MPRVNWLLLVAVIAAIVGFGSSSAMAAAYGIAVTVTMLITTMLTLFVIREWGIPRPLAYAATVFFLAIDGLLVTSCALKFFQGGWFPLVMGLGIFTTMATWKRGRELLFDSLEREGLELQPFIEAISADVRQRAPRTAVYMVANPHTVPMALMHNLKHNCVLHEQNVILSVLFHERAYLDAEERLEVAPLTHDFWSVRVHYGFMEVPDVPAVLARCEPHGIDADPMRTSFFVSRETIVPTPGEGMWTWRERLYAAMQRNAGSAVEFFQLPNNAVIELGTRVQI
jgi:KUP system potassium uptake protein